MKKELLSLSAAVGFVAAATLPTIAVGNNSCPGQRTRFPKWAKAGDTVERCAGIVKKGKNDCRANGHACAGRARVDNHRLEFMWTPKGVCEKFTKGVVRSTAKVPRGLDD